MRDQIKEYSLYLDDERLPKTNKNWVIVRNMAEFQETLLSKGIPIEMSLDHDLGENEPTGYDVVKWYIEQVIEGNLELCEDINIHSANPVGSKNMRSYIDSYLKVRK